MIVSVQLRNGTDPPLPVPPNAWTTVTGYLKVNGDYTPSWLDRLPFGEIWPQPTSCDLMLCAKLDWSSLEDHDVTHVAIRLARDPNAVFRDPLVPVNTTGTDRRSVVPGFGSGDPGEPDWTVWTYLLTGRHTEPLAIQVKHNGTTPVLLLGAEFKARVIPSWP